MALKPLPIRYTINYFNVRLKAGINLNLPHGAKKVEKRKKTKNKNGHARKFL